MKNLHIVLALVTLAPLGCGGVDEEGDLYEEEGVESASEELKEDRAAIPFKTFTDIIGSLGGKATRKVFTSKSAYKNYFGHNPPAAVDFAKEWVVFYSAGMQNSGGYTASLQKLALSNSGLTLKVTTSLSSPGPDCIVTWAFTKPYLLAKFKKPSPRPSYVKFYKNDQVRSCNPSQPSKCAAVLCAPGTHCEEQQIVCVTTPCNPIVSCVPDKVSPCDTVKCAAGFHCEEKQIVCVTTPCNPIAECVADQACAGAAMVGASGQCECNAHGLCITGSFWNSDPAVCGCTSLCATVKCAAGTQCQPVGNSVSCLPIPGYCDSDADCVEVDDYCGGCNCRALAVGESLPMCSSNTVACFAQPCAVNGGKVACVNNVCAFK